jgi:hypothetical protein
MWRCRGSKVRGKGNSGKWEGLRGGEATVLSFCSVFKPEYLCMKVVIGNHHHHHHHHDREGLGVLACSSILQMKLEIIQYKTEEQYFFRTIASTRYSGPYL